MSNLTKPGTALVKNDSDLANVLKCNMHAYLAYGTIEDDEIPTDATALAGLLSGAGQKFVGLGKLTKEALEYGHKRSTVELQDGATREGLTVEGFVESINYGKTFLDLVDAPEMDGDCTLLFLPFGNPAIADVSPTNPQLAVFVRGVTIVDEGKAKGNKTFGSAKLSFTATPDYVQDAIKICKITDDGVA